VIDCQPSSASFGQVVGWSELPTAGNELHHFGWNACSSALCHPARATTGSPWSAATCSSPACGPPAPRSWTPGGSGQPTLVHEITAEELAKGRLLTAPTVHCGPGRSFLFNLGRANGHDGPGGVAQLDHDRFEVIGAWEQDRGEQYFGDDGCWHLHHDTAITPEWATPSMVEHGLDPRT
jgi:methanethiol oxidase